MSNKIAIVDYGMGNLHSVEKAFAKLGYSAKITDSATEVAEADRIVLPGVGAFADAISAMDQKNLTEAVIEGIRSDRPFLGICLGLQLLFEKSEEFGEHAGLGVVPGSVVRFPADMPDKMAPDGNALKVPHLGWNRISKKKNLPLLEGIDDGTYFYFVHSYFVAPTDPDVVATTTEYGIEFVSSISFDRAYACQFHPEKSQKAGLRLLDNFARI